MKRKAKRINQSNKAGGLKNQNTVVGTNESFGFNIPPNDISVKIYFEQKGVGEAAEYFLKEQRQLDWKTSSNKRIHNWKVLASDWIFNYMQAEKYRLRTSKFCSMN